MRFTGTDSAFDSVLADRPRGLELVAHGLLSPPTVLPRSGDSVRASAGRRSLEPVSSDREDVVDLEFESGEFRGTEACRRARRCRSASRPRPAGAGPGWPPPQGPPASTRRRRAWRRACACTRAPSRPWSVTRSRSPSRVILARSGCCSAGVPVHGTRRGGRVERRRCRRGGVAVSARRAPETAAPERRQVRWLWLFGEYHAAGYATTSGNATSSAWSIVLA